MRALIPETVQVPVAESREGVVEIAFRDPDGRVRLAVLAPDRAAAFAAGVMRAVNDARDPDGVEAGTYDGCPMCGVD